MKPLSLSTLSSFAPSTRIDKVRGGFTLYARDRDHASSLFHRIAESPSVSWRRAVEGHEYWRQLGLVAHVYALRIGTAQVRIVSPGTPPKGQFSNLAGLERTVCA
jgi:hypothetical protein